MDGVLCHCQAGADPDGHELGSLMGCEAPKITKGVYSRPYPPSAISQVPGKWINHGMLDARGTCPVCRKPGVRVKQIKVFSNRGRRFELLPPLVNPREERGIPLEIRPGMAPHKVRGRECPGTGQVPTETRYTPGKELAGYLKIMREESEAS